MNTCRFLICWLLLAIPGLAADMKLGRLLVNDANYSGTNRAITVEGFHTSGVSTDALVRVIGGNPISSDINVLLEVGPFDAPVGFRVNNNNSAEVHGVLRAGYGQNIYLLNSNGSPGIDFRPGGDAQQNCFVGFSAGAFAGGFASNNAFFGTSAGSSLTHGKFNTFLGQAAGEHVGTNVDVQFNTFVGHAAGFWTATNQNTFVGAFSGILNSNGTRNAFLGAYSGQAITNASRNTFIGNASGFSALSNSGCVFLGNEAGTWETDSEMLMIDNSQRASLASARSSALIAGKFNASPGLQKIWFNVANMGVGTTNPAAVLEVVGNILASGGSGQIRGDRTDRLALYLPSGGFYAAGAGLDNYIAGNIVMDGALRAGSASTFTNRINALGNIYVRGSNGVANASVGGTIKVDTTKVISAGASETNLITFAVPAHTLTNLNDRLRFRFAGNFAATANAKDLKVIYGSETILDTSSQIVNSGAWTIEGEIIRIGNTSQEVSAEFHGAGVTLFTTASVGLLAQTNGIATTLKMTSTAAGNGDVTNRTLVVMYYPAQ